MPREDCAIINQISAWLPSLPECLNFIRWFWSLGILVDRISGSSCGHRGGSRLLSVWLCVVLFAVGAGPSGSFLLEALWGLFPPGVAVRSVELL